MIAVGEEKKDSGSLGYVFMASIVVLMAALVMLSFEYLGGWKPAVAQVPTSEANIGSSSDVEQLRKEVDALRQRLDDVVGAHKRTVEGAEAAIVLQKRDMMIVARALSDHFGQTNWIKMVERSIAELSAVVVSEKK